MHLDLNRSLHLHRTLTLWLAAAAKRPGKPNSLHLAAAALAPLLWVVIIFAGRFIAYTESL